MAIFLGSKNAEILSWRNVAELVNGLQAGIAEKRRGISASEGMELLGDLRARLDEELTYEGLFEARLTALIDECAAIVDEEMLDVAALHCRQLSEEYFLRRGSVLAYHSLCNRFHDLLFARVLWLAEDWMARHGFGQVPLPHCWFAIGSAGREEGAFVRDFDCLLLHEDGDKDTSSFFVGFSNRVVSMLENIGLRSRSGISPLNPSWRGSRKEWRSRLIEGVSGKGGDGLNYVLPMADLRLLHGEGPLADEVRNLVGSIFAHHKERLQGLAANISVLPVGLDFFGRLRLERSGPHKGEFNLEQYALGPLVASSRIMAIKYDITETTTVNRLKRLMEKGKLGVELTERLLRAYHEFALRRIGSALQQRDEQSPGVYFMPEEQDEALQLEFKSALEALLNLQKLVYLDFVEHG